MALLAAKDSVGAQALAEQEQLVESTRTGPSGGRCGVFRALLRGDVARGRSVQKDA